MAEPEGETGDIVVSNHASLEQRPEFKHSVSRTSLTFYTSDNAKQTAEKKFESLLENHNYALSQSSEAAKISAEEKESSLMRFILGYCVGGEFNIKSKYVVQDPFNVLLLLELLDYLSPSKQDELLTLWVTLLKQSIKNLQACTKVGLIEKLLKKLSDFQDEKIADKVIDLVGDLAMYSITVRELNCFFAALQRTDDIRWPPHALKLLEILQKMPEKHGPDVYFNFSGKQAAAITVPPISKWPHQPGFTFVTWLQLDAAHLSPSEQQHRPHIYSFMNNRGLGYSAHFSGPMLVVQIWGKNGKKQTVLVKSKFEPQMWYHVCISHMYNRFKSSEVKIFVNGAMVTAGDITMPSNKDTMDKCFIGGSHTSDTEHVFKGQMAAVYAFAEPLANNIIIALYRLGPGYKGKFKFRAELESTIPETDKKLIYDGRLAQILLFTYNPKAVDGDLCLESSPTENAMCFYHSPHALMMEGVQAVVTHSLQAAMHSLGGIQMLFPLFAQLDCPLGGASEPEPKICSLLLNLIMDLLRGSSVCQQQMIQSQGFMIIGHLLQKSSPVHLSEKTVDILLGMARYFMATASATGLLGGLLDHVLLEPSLWIKTPIALQSNLLSLFATGYVGGLDYAGYIRKEVGVPRLILMLRKYYSVKGTQNTSVEEVISLRAFVLLLVKQMIIKDHGILEDELKSILVYLAVEEEEGNYTDILQLLLSVMCETPDSMIPCFDAMEGFHVFFKLLVANDETIRITSLKILCAYVQQLNVKRKLELVEKYSFISKIGQKLSIFDMTMVTYNGLFELLTARATKMISQNRHASPDSTYVMYHPSVLPIIVNLLLKARKEAEESENEDLIKENFELTSIFLSDLVLLLNCNNDNKRLLLQLMCWQDWMFTLAYFEPQTKEESKITDSVFSIIKMLLYYAIQNEKEGWRVWVDTLSILHVKVAKGQNEEEVTEEEGQEDEEVEELHVKEPHVIYDDKKAAPEYIDQETGELKDVPGEPVAPKTVPLAPHESAEEEVVKPAEPVEPTSTSEESEGDQSEKVTSEEDPQEELQQKEPLPEELPQNESPQEETAPETSENVSPDDEKKKFFEKLKQSAAQVPGSQEEAEPEEKKDTDEPSANNQETDSPDKHVATISHVIKTNEKEPSTAVSLDDNHEKKVTTENTSPNSVSLSDNDVGSSSQTQEATHADGDVTLTNVTDSADSTSSKSPEQKARPYVDIPEFTWSNPHQRLLTELLFSIETDIQVWKTHTRKVITDFVSSRENSIYIMNLCHMVSILSDSLIYCCGGLLPLLASATSKNFTNDVLEPCGGMTLDAGFSFLNRILNVVDIVAFATSMNFSAVEQHRNMSGGGVLRQCIRLVFCGAARNRVVCRQRERPLRDVSNVPHKTLKETQEAIKTLIASTKPPTDEDVVQNIPGHMTTITNPERLLQDSDIYRLRALVYREVEDNRQSQYVALVVIYLVAVLMVARYRDILEHEDVVEPEERGSTSDSATKDENQVLSLTLEERIDMAFHTSASLLREILFDFSHYLSRVLVGSRGQDLISDGLGSLKSEDSTVELVMLLCSQEWQNALQRQAGTAFMDLVDEGRLLSHSTRERIVITGGEALDIMKERDGVENLKHAQFETLCTRTIIAYMAQYKTYDQFFKAKKKRNSSSATQSLEKIFDVLTSDFGAWPLPAENQHYEYYKMDRWEDMQRRRMRMVKNPCGTSHPEATLRPGSAEVVPPEKPPPLKYHTFTKQIPTETGSDDEDEVELDTTIEEKEVFQHDGSIVLTTECKVISPGAIVPGTLAITSDSLYFTAEEECEELRHIDPAILNYNDCLNIKCSFGNIVAVFTRRYVLQHKAIEVFLANRRSFMFAFTTQDIVKKVIQHLPAVGIGSTFGVPKSRSISAASPRQHFMKSNMTHKWQNQEISNFEYLMFLNTIAGRTYNDINQYFVFPWILKNYESEDIDLKDSENYRDLSKPIGALNPFRLAGFVERFDSWDESGNNVPPFHYGTHYSTGGFVMNWLIRLEPFASLFLGLQGGKFDHPLRTFSSVKRAWENCQRDTSDVKELIPELFYQPEMFVNSNRFIFGDGDEAKDLDHVELPTWAESPEHFIHVHREALESEYVSNNLHKWIDLIFGYKQKGKDAEHNANVFYHLTYEGSVDLDNITDIVTKEALEEQIKSFGQTPQQLLTTPHPPRNANKPEAEEPHKSIFLSFTVTPEIPVTYVSAFTSEKNQLPAIITISCNQVFSVNKWINFGGNITSYQSLKHVQIEQDPSLESLTGRLRRQLGEPLHESVTVTSSCFRVTSDNKCIFTCGYWDKSFKCFSTESGKLMQCIYGHWDVVTCLAYADDELTSTNAIVVSGSADATILVWIWDHKRHKIIGSEDSSGFGSTPIAICIGHKLPVTCVDINTSIGIIASGSVEGPCLVHSLSGELLRCLNGPDICRHPRLVTISNDSRILVNYSTESGYMAMFTSNGKLMNSIKMTDQVFAVVFTKDGSFFITGGFNRSFHVWRSFDLTLLSIFPPCDGSIRCLALTPDQKCMIAGLSTGSIIAMAMDFNMWPRIRASLIDDEALDEKTEQNTTISPDHENTSAISEVTTGIERMNADSLPDDSDKDVVLNAQQGGGMISVPAEEFEETYTLKSMAESNGYTNPDKEVAAETTEETSSSPQVFHFIEDKSATEPPVHEAAETVSESNVAETTSVETASGATAMEESDVKSESPDSTAEVTNETKLRIAEVSLTESGADETSIVEQEEDTGHNELTTEEPSVEEATSPESSVYEIPTPVPSVEDTPTPEPSVEDTPTPEPSVEDTPTPEPSVEDSPTPEPSLEDSPTPEPSVEETSTPEPSVEETSTPEPSVEETSTPEPSVEETSTPERSVEEMSTPEPSVEETSTPEPSVEETSTPEPSVEETSTPEPSSEEVSTPEPSVEETSTPEPSVEETSTPEPSSEEVSTPEPSTEEALTLTPEPCAEETAVSEPSAEGTTVSEPIVGETAMAEAAVEKTTSKPALEEAETSKIAIEETCSSEQTVTETISSEKDISEPSEQTMQCTINETSAENEVSNENPLSSSDTSIDSVLSISADGTAQDGSVSVVADQTF